jgi:uncharacterized membrane protein
VSRRAQLVAAVVMLVVGIGLATWGTVLATSTDPYTDGREFGAVVFVGGLVLSLAGGITWPIGRSK